MESSARRKHSLIWRELYCLRDDRFHRPAHDFIIRLNFHLSMAHTPDAWDVNKNELLNLPD
jgi:hypothetical protein